MSGELAGRVAVVTGGASGIGRASVRRFVEHGAKVVIADVDEEGGEKLAAELGSSALFQRTDVSKVGDVQALVDRAVSHFGGLHVMFNNAGISSNKSPRFLDLDLGDFERVMGVDLYGVMVGTQRAARHMAGHGGGSIINTTSIAALRPGPGVVTYRAAKAGVILFSRSVAIELGAHGVRVNCIAPGLIPTAINAESYDHDEVARLMQPLRRRGEPEDVANAALYLASDRSAQVTGMVLPVDGGASLGPPTAPGRKG